MPNFMFYIPQLFLKKKRLIDSVMKMPMKNQFCSHYSPIYTKDLTIFENLLKYSVPQFLFDSDYISHIHRRLVEGK